MVSFNIYPQLSSNWLISQISDIIFNLLKQVDNNPEQVIMDLLPRTHSDIKNIINAQLREIFTYNISGKELVHMSNIEQKMNEFNSLSRLPNALKAFTSNITSDAINAKKLNITGKHLDDYIKYTIIQEKGKINRLAISENILASNWARANKYDSSAMRDGYKYKWLVYFDHRTTNQCKEIHHRQGDGLPLNELKALIREVAEKYEPKYLWRDWEAHFYERSKLVRV